MTVEVVDSADTSAEQSVSDVCGCSDTSVVVPTLSLSNSSFYWEAEMILVVSLIPMSS